MKTQQNVLNAIKAGRKSEAIDGRDYVRLADFFPVSDWEHLGVSLKEGAEAPQPKEWNRDNILEQLKKDVAFGFEKALDQRGLSADAMHGVVKMWMWILDDDLQYHDAYAQYGLPLLKLVAVKFGFPNEIGDDTGNEDKYAAGN